jgi:pyruvate/2-oxoglutarate dehydrogenase complex dihydrolipoamide dehydrogenase (E3) component
MRLPVAIITPPRTAAAGKGEAPDRRGELSSAADQTPVLGATFVGSEVAELLHAATVAIVGKVDSRCCGTRCRRNPTASEIWLRLLEARRAG